MNPNILKNITLEKFIELNIFDGKKFKNLKMFGYYDEDLMMKLLCKNRNIPVKLLIGHSYNYSNNTYLSVRCTLEELKTYKNLLNINIYYNDNIPINYKLKFIDYFISNRDYINLFELSKLTKLTMRNIYEYDLLNYYKFEYFFRYPFEYFLLYPCENYIKINNNKQLKIINELIKLRLLGRIKIIHIDCSEINDLELEIDNTIIYTIKNPTINIYKKYQHIDKLSNLSSNNRITIEDVINNPSIGWDYDDLSENPNITSEIILKYPGLQWNNILFNVNKHDKPEYYRRLKNKFQTETITELKLFPGEPRFPIAPPLAFG